MKHHNGHSDTKSAGTGTYAHLMSPNCSPYHLSFSLICRSLSLVTSSFSSSSWSLCLWRSVLAAWSFSFSCCIISICSFNSFLIFSSWDFSLPVRLNAFFTLSRSLDVSSLSLLLQYRDEIKWYRSKSQQICKWCSYHFID